MAKAGGFVDPNKRELYKLPSRFGSHQSMVNEEKTKELNDPKLVVLVDEFGEYVTEKNRLDNGSSDPNRYEVGRISRLFAGKEK